LADERGLALFEDGAQAHGSSRDGVAPGELGDACSFSFYPTKNLGAAGEGGLVVTQKDDVAERLRRLRDHGSSEKYLHAFVGTNSRLHALQAAFLNVKLPHLEAWNERRRVAAARYDAAFASTQIVEPLRRHEGAVHAFHQYTVRVRPPASRDAVLEHLRERQIFAAVHYPLPVHLQEAAADWGYAEGSLPHAEALAREVLSLPIHPFLSESDQARVIDEVRAAVGA
jgi:dTDP-4-amino-4,6-dideoxygalactose transaminase